MSFIKAFKCSEFCFSSFIDTKESENVDPLSIFHINHIQPQSQHTELPLKRTQAGERDL